MEIVKIKGMSCEHCTAAVKKALEACGLTSVQVDLASGTATFENLEGADTDTVADAVRKAGYEVIAPESE